MLQTLSTLPRLLSGRTPVIDLCDQDRPGQVQDLAAFKTWYCSYDEGHDQILLDWATPPQSKSQSNSRDKDPSHDLEDSSEGEISDLDHHEDPELNQGNPELDQLVHTAEEQQDFDSFTLASPRVSLQRVRLLIFSSSDTGPDYKHSGSACYRNSVSAFN